MARGNPGRTSSLAVKKLIKKDMLFLTLMNGAIESAAVWSALVVGATIIYFFLWRQKRVKIIQMVDRLPGPGYDSNVFGHALMFNVKREERFTRIMDVLKDFIGQHVVRLWIGNDARVILLTPEAVEALLSSQKEIDKGQQYRFLVPWIGEGLVIGSGKKWHSRRKLLTPAFHFKILEECMQVFNEQAAILVEETQKTSDDVVDYYPYLKHCALDIICETAMGCTVNAQRQGENKYVQAVADQAEVFSRRSLSPWLHNDFLFQFTALGRKQKENQKILHGFTNQVINDRRQEYMRKKLEAEQNGGSDVSEPEVLGQKRRMAFLDVLLESSDKGLKLTHEDIREEVDTFMFEGHDTTATSMIWTLFALAKHPEIQEKVHQEMDSIFGDSDRPVTGEDLRDLKYLDCVIKEGMRLYPPVPFFGRTLREDLTTCGHTIPAGTTVLVFNYFVHRDPAHFPDPERFDPDRFDSAVGGQKRHPYSYIPFSAGPRNCIGQKFAVWEEKVVLSHILRKFRVACDQSFQDLKVVAEIVLRPSHGSGIQLKFERRTRSSAHLAAEE